MHWWRFVRRRASGENGQLTGFGILYPFFAQVVSHELAALLMVRNSLSVTLNTLRMRGFVPAIRRRGRTEVSSASAVALPTSG